MTKQIPLTQGKVAIVDDDMYEFLSQWKWRSAKDKNTWYAVRSIARKTIGMHRVITNASPGQLVDHWNGDGLYNVRQNLRVCTDGQNRANRRIQKNNKSGFKGVCWSKDKKKFHAYITSGNIIHLGYFNDPEAAARAYDAKARELHGEFARTNF